MSIDAATYSGASFSEFTPDFWDEIAHSNREKNHSAPVAQILFGSYKPGKALYSLITQFQILNLCKTYYVAIGIIYDKQNIHQQLYQTSEGYKRMIQLLIIYAHGVSSGMRFNDQIYQESDVKRSDYEGLDKNAQIVLFSCCVERSLAQKIANITKRIVLATNQVLHGEDTCLCVCPQHGLEMKLYIKGRQEMYRFEKGKQQIACPSNRSDDAQYFSELKNYLIEKAQEGDVVTYYSLGYLAEQENDRQGAVMWYQQAADYGSDKGLYSLGSMFFKNHEWGRAKVYFQQAADRGLSVAHYFLGYIFEKQGDIANAKQHYQQVDDQRSSEAQQRLSRLSEKEDELVGECRKAQ